MYQALYRKYRPQTFNDVVGQEIIIKTLKNSIIQNKISHAYLFAGPRGSGKTTIAKILAKTVNCQNLNGVEACNKCVCCTQNNSQNMDIIEIDAASNNGVDEIREINNKVNLVPSLGRYKIYIIDEVHMLTIGAFNALLKTLEEPPSHVIFILATTDPQKVPITILSRCQRFDFKKISEGKIAERLQYIVEQEKINIQVSALNEIARLGDGSLRDSIGILDQVIAYADGEVTLKDVHDVNGTISQQDLKLLIENICQNKIAEVMNILDEYSNNGKNIVKITEEIILFFKNIILASVSNKYGNSIYQEFVKINTKNEFLNCIQVLNETLLDMKKFSNPKMLLELALIKIMTTSHDTEKILTVKEIKKENQETDKLMKIEQQQNEKNDGVKQCQTNISWEMKKQEDEIPKLEIWKQIRIQNTLAKFSKKELLDIKSNLNCDEYLLDEKFSQYASLIMDGTLKAASTEYLIFVYKTSHLEKTFNTNVINIEKFIKKILSKEYKCVAVNEEEWDLIKETFNNKSKKYEYQEETIDIKELLNNKKLNKVDDMKSLFGDLVEYN